MATDSPSQQMGEVLSGLGGICDQVGFPRELLTQELATRTIVPCIIEAACEDYDTIHPPYTNPVMREHFGERSFSEGTFKTHIRELAAVEVGPHQLALDNILRTCGGLLARQVITNIVNAPPTRTLTIKKAQHRLEFDTEQASLAREIKHVIDYGPGLQGKFRIIEQFTDITEQRIPYQYMALDKGPFINAFLQGCWQQLARDPDSYQKIMQKQIYTGSEQGMAAASTELIASEQQQGNSGEVADLIIAANIHTTNESELETAIANAHTLLRPSGSLFVRAPSDNPQGGHLTARDIIAIAYDHGFAPHKVRIFRRRMGEQQMPVMWLSALLNK